MTSGNLSGWTGMTDSGLQETPLESPLSAMELSGNNLSGRFRRATIE